jgi:hypothetical protein
MPHSALLWCDDHCSRERVYSFSQKADLVDMQTLSLDRSACYLERHVFCVTRSNGAAFDARAEQYVLRPRPMDTAEAFLHRRVQYWKHHRHLISLELFCQLTKARLSPVLHIVRSYLYSSPSEDVVVL